MAGGTWLTQNKVRPGAYINTVGIQPATNDSVLGTTLLVGSKDLNWGKKGVTALTLDSDFRAALGINSLDEYPVLREVFKGASKVLYLNNNDGVQASITDPVIPWKFTAKYAGTKGNQISVLVEKDPTDTSDDPLFTVSTLYGTVLVDKQQVHISTSNNLADNDYLNVEFVDADGNPINPEVNATAGGATFTVDIDSSPLKTFTGSHTYALTGGTSVPVDMATLLNDALENEQYAVVTTAGNSGEATIHALLVSQVQRLREDEGYKVRAVIPYYAGGTIPNYEGVSVVAQGVTLDNGEVLDIPTATGWFAGASSAADVNVSLTYAEYPNAVDVNPRYNNDQTIKALNSGLIVFTVKRDGAVVVEQDINSLHTIPQGKNKDFRKNRVMRTLDGIALNTQITFENSYIGKVNNDATGQGLFKANRISYLNTLVGIGAIQAFDNDDISVAAGNDKDSIVVNVAVTPIDSMEKLYMTINVY